jgi:hypothetical protein
MGRRLRGPGSVSARAAGEPSERVTMEITVSRDTGDRVRAIQSRTGESPGEIVERLLSPQLGGVRVASVPDRLLPARREAPTVGESEGGEGGQTSGGETLPIAETVTATDKAPQVPAGGGGEKAAKGRDVMDRVNRRAKAG